MAHTRRTLQLTTVNRSTRGENSFDFRAAPDVRQAQDVRAGFAEPQFFPAWDLTLDSSGRLALASGAAATAQNVANEARLFTDDAYFIRDRGLPHFAIDLGQRLNPAIVRAHLRRAALAVADVREVLAVNIETLDSETRVLSGSLEFNTVEDDNGAITTHF